MRSTSFVTLVMPLTLIALLAGACAETSTPLTVDQRVASTEAQLKADGATAEVAACVVSLARHDLRRGPLDDLAREELMLSCERAQASLESEDGENRAPNDLAFVDGPHTLGDDPALDRLWVACEEGSGAACDELFEMSPVGSDYERFAVSCGDRDEILHCSELDSESDGEIDGELNEEPLP